MCTGTNAVSVGEPHSFGKTMVTVWLWEMSKTLPTNCKAVYLFMSHNNYDTAFIRQLMS